MDALTIAQLGIGIFGALSFLFIIRNDEGSQKIGTILGIISNPFWWTMAIVTEQWITIPVHILFTYGYIHKTYVLWWRKKPMPLATVVAKVEADQYNILHWRAGPDFSMDSDYDGDFDTWFRENVVFATHIWFDIHEDRVEVKIL